MNRILLFVFLIFCYSAYADNFKIIGTVRHGNSYQPVDNANIYIENTTIGTISSVDGTFELEIDSSTIVQTLIIEHVAFDSLRISVRDAINEHNFYLWPRLLSLSQISVLAERDEPDIRRDLPQPVVIIPERMFAARGFIDAADLLHTEQSVQVSEETSGKKTIALRAGNPDDVIILYNGVRLNSMYDNIYDLSLISLEDVRQVEIIKGSNSSLYGPDAFSGIINIVPKMNRGYNIRFQQRLGTYASGDWNLQLSFSPKNWINFSYSFKTGASRKNYILEESENDFIENTNGSHNASISFDLSNIRHANRSLTLLFYQTNTTYENNRYHENLMNQDQLFSINYKGDLFSIDRLSLIGAYQSFDNDQKILYQSDIITRAFKNNSYSFHLDKETSWRNFDFILGYDFKQNNLKYFDDRQLSFEEPLGLTSGNFYDNNHGLVFISKFHLPEQSKYINRADIDLSIRHDWLIQNSADLRLQNGSTDQTDDAPGIFQDTRWNKTTFKYSSHFSGTRGNVSINGYMNFGKNVKFPSLFQRLSLPIPAGLNLISFPSRLAPEENTSLELGIDLIRENLKLHNWDGWQFHLNIFRNYYANKFRTFYSPGIPVPFYDNVPNANIFGLEYSMKIFMAKSKVTIEFGGSNYNVSDKAAFPFKSGDKQIINIQMEHAGFLAQVHLFREGEQIGWVQSFQGAPWQIYLPGYANIDFHIGKDLYLGKLKLFTNFSGRNLLDTKTSLAGIALRDTRYYVSFGVQY